MNFFRRLKTKYGIAHPLCVLSLAACLFLCVFIICTALVNYESGMSSQVTNVSEAVDMQELRNFGEEIFDTIISSYSQVIAIGIEPLLAVIVHGFAGLLNAMIGMPLDIENSVFSLPEVLLIAVAIYSIGKLMQCFECTRSFTMITFGEFERILGYVMMIIISCRNVIKVIYVCDKHNTMFKTIFHGIKTEWIVALLVLFVGVISSFVGIMIFYITKTLVLGLQIMQLSISFFPFTSFLFEVLRSSATITMAMFNLLFPRVGFAFNCAAFILGIIFLSQTSSSVEYFRVIYIESLLIPYYRFKGRIETLYKDVPTEIRKKCRDKNGIIVPVFSMEQFQIGEIDVAGHEKWWMEVSEEGLHFYRKKFLSFKVESFSIGKNEKKWYFKDNWKCLEIFDLNGPEENIIRLFKKPEREISLAISREYEAIFKEIVVGMEATDYNALKTRLTDERRSLMEKENKAFYAVTQ
ncbi:MAG: hypothetical protein IJZ42_06225 [Lachnospiraceae bacterium]|nr:hypothetical protein [Lachnospiraceae bacterium]